MALRRTSDRPLPKQMLTNFYDAICQSQIKYTNTNKWLWNLSKQHCFAWRFICLVTNTACCLIDTIKAAVLAVFSSHYNSLEQRTSIDGIFGTWSPNMSQWLNVQVTLEDCSSSNAHYDNMPHYMFGSECVCVVYHPLNSNQKLYKPTPLPPPVHSQFLSPCMDLTPLARIRWNKQRAVQLAAINANNIFVFCSLTSQADFLDYGEQSSFVS